MRLYEFITKKEVTQFIDGLDEKQDQETLSKIYNSARHAEITDELTTANKTVLKNLDKTQLSNFNNIFAVHGSDSSFAAIKEYFTLLKTERFGPEKLEKLSSGSLTDLVSPAMAENSVFKKTLPYIIDSSKGTASGYGKGELFFMVYGLNAKKLPSQAHADVDLNGWKVEVKGKGAAVNPGKDGGGTQTVNIVDDLNSQLRTLAKTKGIKLNTEEGKKNGTNLVSGWLPSLFMGLTEVDGEQSALGVFKDYIQKLYRMDGAQADKMAKAVFPLLGTPESNRVWSSFVINKAKAQSTWDSTIVIDTESPNGAFINIVDGNDLPSSLSFRPVLTKGKGTYAYPDGALMVSISGAGQTQQENLNKYKTEIENTKKRWEELTNSHNVPEKTAAKVERLLSDVQAKYERTTKSGRWGQVGGLSKTLDSINNLITDIENGKTVITRGRRKGSTVTQPKADKPTKAVDPEQQELERQALNAKAEESKKEQSLENLALSMMRTNPSLQQIITKSKTRGAKDGEILDDIKYYIEQGMSADQIAKQIENNYLSEQALKKARMVRESRRSKRR